jgi:hypothetical protein
MKKTVYSSVWVCRISMDKTRGINQRDPFGCKGTLIAETAVYISSLVAHSMVEAKNLLRSLRGSHLRAVVGSVRTTPTEALK